MPKQAIKPQTSQHGGVDFETTTMCVCGGRWCGNDITRHCLGQTANLNDYFLPCTARKPSILPLKRVPISSKGIIIECGASILTLVKDLKLSRYGNYHGH